MRIVFDPVHVAPRPLLGLHINCPLLESSRRPGRRDVPLDNARAMVATGVAVEDAAGSRTDREVSRHAQGKADPADAQHAAEVTVGEGRHPAGERSPPGDQSVGARRDLRRRFAAGAAVRVDVPRRPVRADFVHPLAVVVPVVPFGEIGLAGVAGGLYGTV